MVRLTRIKTRHISIGRYDIRMLVEQLDIFTDFPVHFRHNLMQEIRVNVLWQNYFWTANDELGLEVFYFLMLYRHKIILQQRRFDLLEWLIDKPRLNEVQFSSLNIKIHVLSNFFDLSTQNFVNFNLINIDF